MTSDEWWALPRCPRCFRAWACVSVRGGRVLRRPHVERTRLARERRERDAQLERFGVSA